jgi:hypothetical protein
MLFREGTWDARVAITMKRAVVAIALLALAVAPSRAGADPEKHEKAGRLRYDEDHAPRQTATPCTGCLVELATPTPASHGTEFIPVGRDVGTFTALRIAAHRGRVIVRRVRVELADGGSRRFDVDRVIGGEREATIRFDKPVAIERVVVSTEIGNGSYVVSGVYGESPLTGER